MLKSIVLGALLVVVLAVSPVQAQQQQAQAQGAPPALTPAQTAMLQKWKTTPHWQGKWFKALLVTPGLQARAFEAQRTGANDASCDGHQGARHHGSYEVQTGTDPNGFYYDPLCPQGRLMYNENEEK
jgi:hypothetical protein